MSDVEQAGRAGNRAPGTSAPAPVYVRPLPGGGKVRVELVVSDRGDVAGERALGRVVIDGRTANAEPMVLEEIEGADAEPLVDELFRIAHDNAAIARRILRRYPARNAISI